ncbi:uncharacterized protein LOC118413054 [Branchiostoma floridae]|uniref:Uncharacterized protein LOC118413054 n=1 Tax=Branchiostoma floridae TaxID=7739 RepID=A0A9J7KY06_BRAFL|nr:uncharacterized protein LOC118413054 [Branchiostoma floridae]
MQQPQTDWQVRADAAASIPNPMYACKAGATPMQQPQTDWQSRADAAASKPNPLYASGADRTSQGGSGGRGALCSFILSNRSCMTAGIAVLVSLIAVGLVPLAVDINKERNEDDMRQLSTTVDALKLGLEKERNRTTALEQRLQEMNMTPAAG